MVGVVERVGVGETVGVGEVGYHTEMGTATWPLVAMHRRSEAAEAPPKA